MGWRITQLDSNGTPYLPEPDEQTIGLYGKIRDMVSDKALYFSSKEYEPSSQIIPMFSANQTLFLSYTMFILEREGIRNGADFGILPMPKYDEQQENYHTSTFPDVSAIPLVVKDIDMSQIILEALNSTAYRVTVPAFYQVCLQDKMTRDTESVEMLELLADSVTFGFGNLFFSTIDSDFYLLVQKLKNSDYATWWAKHSKSANKNLSTILESIEEISANKE